MSSHAAALADRVERLVLSKTRNSSGVPIQDVTAKHVTDVKDMVPPCELLIDNEGVVHPYSPHLASNPGLCRPYYGSGEAELDEELLVYERRLRATSSSTDEEREKEAIRRELRALVEVAEGGKKIKMPPPPPPLKDAVIKEPNMQ